MHKYQIVVQAHSKATKLLCCMSYAQMELLLATVTTKDKMVYSIQHTLVQVFLLPKKHIRAVDY